MKKRLLAVVLGCLGLAGCSSHSENCVWPENAVLIDVRSQAEFDSGHLKNAVLIPHDVIGEKISEIVPDKKTPLYLYCRSGRRVAVAMKVLQAMGYSELHNLGGMEDARRAIEGCAAAPAGSSGL